MGRPQTAVLLALFSCALVCGFAAAKTTMAPPLPQSWEDVTGTAPLSKDTVLELLISLQPESRERKELIKTYALESSDPDSKRYGKHLSMDEVRQLSAASAEAVASVINHFSVGGVKASLSASGNLVSVRGTAADLEGVLSTSFSTVRESKRGGRKLRAGAYSIPDHVARHVAAVFGLHGLPLPRKDSLTSQGGVATVTPSVIRSTYGISGVTPSGNLKNRQAVGEFQGQTFQDSDLTSFFKTFVPFSKNESDAKIYKVVGQESGGSGVEAALDVEYIMGVAPGILTEFWGYQGRDFCMDLMQFTNKILSTADAPNVFSISYGWQGELSTVGCQDDQVTAVDANWASIAARGISVIISSGDSGSGMTSGGQGPTCDQTTEGVEYDGKQDDLGNAGGVGDCCSKAQDEGYSLFNFVRGGFFRPSKCYGLHSSNGTINNGKATSGKASSQSNVKLYASWPASSQWVTAVGATRFINQDPSAAEMATDQFGSGGGFSFRFAQQPNASWQAADTQKYIAADKGDLPPKGSYPAGGRGTPDVSALGEGFQVIGNGRTLSVGGTSASAPTFAAIVSLLNEARMSAGKPPLGFLNPFLYKNSAAFTDITKGSNKINRQGMQVQYGWECLEGWDPATGLGVPVFSKLLQAATSA